MTETVVKDEAWWTEWHLGNWSRWMRQRDLPDGFPDCAVGGFENYRTFDSNSERAYEALDAWSADTTNAVVRGLIESERAAIDHAYLHAVYRFPRFNYDELLMRAKANVRDGLTRRGVWLGE